MALVKGISMASVFAVDFKRAYDFYSGVLGLEMSFEMGDAAGYFALGEQGFYLQGGNVQAEYKDNTSRVSFTFDVESISALWEVLKKADVKTLSDTPVQMGEEQWWFQFYDTEGNIIEALGGK